MLVGQGTFHEADRGTRQIRQIMADSIQAGHATGRERNANGSVVERRTASFQVLDERLENRGSPRSNAGRKRKQA